MKVLVIGYGSIGKRHIDNLSKLGDFEIFVYTKRKQDAFLKKRNCKIFNSLKSCISQKPCFAIVSNKTNYHLKIARKLAESGINLFIEKPLSNNEKNIEQLEGIVNRKHLITYIGCNLRFHPSLIKMKQLISTNKIGTPLSVQVENGSFLPEWHPYEDYSKSYSAYENSSGGIILNNIHEIDYLYWFFGKIKYVMSFTEKLSNLKINSSDISCILLKFENKVIGEVHLDYFQKPNFRSCKIIGTKGLLYWNSDTNSVNLYNYMTNKWSETKIKNFNINNTYKSELSHFIDCVRKNKKTINDLEQGKYTLKVALSTKRSSDLKRVVTIK